MSTTEGSRSRSFRSSFPDYERPDFRSISWKVGVPEGREELRPYHKTVLHAFAVAGRLEEQSGITLLPDREGRDVLHKSYRELYHDARRLAAALKDLGVKKGDRVLLVLPTSLDFVAAFFGAQLIHAIPVPAYPPGGFKVESGLRRLAHIANHSRSRVCLTWRKLTPVIGDLAMRARKLRRIVNVEDIRDTDPLDARFKCEEDDIAFLQYTSGSTGNPKGVALEHRNLVANIHAIGQAIEVNHEDRYCGWCPLYHDMGLIGQLLFSIYWRIPAVLLSPVAFLSKPLRWLRAISQYRATISTAPNFGYALAVKRVKPEDREGLDLSSWRQALNGAEPVNLGTLQSFLEIYAPYGFRDTAFLPVYGLAEASLAVTFPKPGSRLRYEVVDRTELANGRALLSSGEGTATLVSVGRAIPGHEAVVLDERGQPLPEREVGHIVASGPSVMRGYWEDDDATRKVLHDDWLWTGDLGYFAEGQLYVAGRAKDLIIVRGSNYYAEDLERSVESVEGVRAGGAVAFGVYDEDRASDLVVLVCETRSEGDEERARLAERIGEVVLEECGLPADEVVLVPPGTVPKTSSGKRQRALCRRLYLKNQLEPQRTGKLKMASVFMRSQAGFLVMQARKLMRRRREPE